MKKRFFGLVMAMMLVIAASFAAVACSGNTVTADENTVVITVKGEQENGKTLARYMDELVSQGELVYTFSDGMVTSINGKANTTNSYWMLYTSDTENANEQWGVFEYEGKHYGSATLGASELIVKENCLYIWAYQTF